MHVPNVSLLNQSACVVDRLRIAGLEHARLQAALEKLRQREAEADIKLGLALRQHTELREAAHERCALEQTLRVLVKRGIKNERRRHVKQRTKNNSDKQKTNKTENKKGPSFQGRTAQCMMP